jgi:hypothetical protein
MTRKHWLEAGEYLLEGVFRHVKDPDAPIVFPKQAAKLYPREDDPPWKHRAMEFEGLARTFMLAAPVLAEKPDLTIGGRGIRDYYAQQILNLCDPQSPRYVGKIAELEEKYRAKLYQHTVEGAALTVGLLASKSVIWERYSRSEKDRIAGMLSDFAHARTNGHNWRWFNVLMAAFLKLNGYKVDETKIRDHLQNLLAYYAGDGWYRDHALFDYYSCWGFQFYGSIWCWCYGYEHEPEAARVIEQRHAELMETYPLMFGRNGYSLMWGRSSIYRCAASAPLAGAFLLKQTPVDAGWARRICSGNLLQFLTRDDFLVDGAPSLGFYGTFEPMVQGYSCAASPFWVSKVFLALALPADSPFWTARENEGPWRRLGGKRKTAILNGPGLALTIHGPTGAAELRSGKISGKSGDPNYTRLSYNTAFLWESDSKAGATAMSYCIREAGAEKEFSPSVDLLWAGAGGGVLYRLAHLRSWMARIDLADIVVPGGVIRVDRIRAPQDYELHLGHYALPHLDGQVATTKEFQVEGQPAITAAIPGRRVALVACRGWDGVGAMKHEGLNAEARESTVIYAHRLRPSINSGVELLVTLMLHATDDGEFAAEQLALIAEMEFLPFAPSGQPCGLRLKLRTGEELLVDYGNIEGRIQA